MATRRARMRATLKAAMEAWTTPGFLVLLFVAGLAYIAFGGTFDAPSPFEPETSIAVVAAVKAENSGNAARGENVLGLFALPTETLFLPARHIKLQ